MIARDLMQTAVRTLREDAPLTEACDLFLEENVNGAPVVDAAGSLVGIITQQDVFFGTLGLPVPVNQASGAVPGLFDPIGALRVRDVMTSPAVCASEDVDVAELCRLMWSLRIHRIPIVRDGLVAGIVSSMDLCHAVSEGSLAVPVVPAVPA
jgi:CBS domain-containing protein